MSDVYLMFTSKNDILIDKGQFVNISDLNKQFALCNCQQFIATKQEQHKILRQNDF